MKPVIAIDPGTDESGVVIWDGEKIIHSEKFWNKDILNLLRDGWPRGLDCDLTIEQIRSYGKPVGQEVFDTCVWCGRFEEAWYSSTGQSTTYISRLDVKKNICHRGIADDGQIRKCLIDRFGPKPTKKKDNPVYNGFKPAYDEWQAWALAVTYVDQRGE